MPDFGWTREAGRDDLSSDRPFAPSVPLCLPLTDQTFNVHDQERGAPETMLGAPEDARPSLVPIQRSLVNPFRLPRTIQDEGGPFSMIARLLAKDGRGEDVVRSHLLAALSSARRSRRLLSRTGGTCRPGCCGRSIKRQIRYARATHTRTGALTDLRKGDLLLAVGVPRCGLHRFLLPVMQKG